MFNNLSGKVKILSYITFYIMLISGFIYGIVCMSNEMVGIGLLIWLGSFLAAWISILIPLLLVQISENVDYIIYHKSTETKLPDKEVNESNWKCSNCGRVNSNFVGTCACGKTKEESKSSSI